MSHGTNGFCRPQRNTSVVPPPRMQACGIQRLTSPPWFPCWCWCHCGWSSHSLGSPCALCCSGRGCSGIAHNAESHSSVGRLCPVARTTSCQDNRRCCFCNFAVVLAGGGGDNEGIRQCKQGNGCVIPYSKAAPTNFAAESTTYSGVHYGAYWGAY